MNLHLEYNGTHYYHFGEVRNVGHKAVPELTKGQDRWYVSDNELDQTGFYQIVSERVGPTFKLRDDLPTWFVSAFDVSILPKQLESEDEIWKVCEAGGLDVSMNDWDHMEVKPFNPYRSEYNYTEHHEPIDGEWVHREGKPAPTVPFVWRAEFPAAVREFPELHHLFPVRLSFSDGWKHQLRNAIEQRGGDAIKNAYCNSDIAVFWRADIPMLKLDFPRLTAENLDALKIAYDDWYGRLMARIDSYVFASDNKCPLCHGTGTAAPIDSERIDAVLEALLNSARDLNNARGKNKDSAYTTLRHRAKELHQVALEAASANVTKL